MGEPFEFHEDINGAVVNVRHGGDRIGEFVFVFQFEMVFVSIYSTGHSITKKKPFRLMQRFGRVTLRTKSRFWQSDSN